MLATILKSKIATEIIIKIMDAFVLMRHLIVDNSEIIDILDETKNEIIIIDSYVDKTFTGDKVQFDYNKK